MRTRRRLGLTPALSSWLPTIIFVPLIGFALYRRVRRTFGRQELSPRRMMARMALQSLVGVLLVTVWLPTPAGFAAAATGLACGIGLAIFGLRHTTFDVSEKGSFYIPNPWIGLGVTALFLGRVAGRMFTLSEHAAVAHADATSQAPMSGLQRSPLTLGLFFVLAGYYVSYYAGILRKVTRLKAGNT